MYRGNLKNRVTARELRARLKNYTRADHASVLATEYQILAVIVPVPEYHRWNDKEERAALNKAKQLFADALRELETNTH
jgi:hypothetical protein